MAEDLDNLMDAGLTEDIPVMVGGKKQLLKGGSVVSAPEPAAAPAAQSDEPAEAEVEAAPDIDGRAGDLESQYEADAKEIEKIEDERMPERIDAEETQKMEETVEDLVEGVLTGGAVTIKDEEMTRRFRSMLEAFFRGIRDSLETKSKMTMPKTSGGLGMKEGDAEKLVAMLARKKAGFEGGISKRLEAERQTFVAERAQRQLSETAERDQKEKDDLDERFMGLTGEGPNITVEEEAPAAPAEPKIIPISDGKAEGAGEAEEATEEAVPQQEEERSVEPEPEPEAKSEPTPEPMAEPEPESAPESVLETEPAPEPEPDEPAKEDPDSSFLDMLDSDLKEDGPASAEEKPAPQPPPDLPVADASAETGAGETASEPAAEEPKAEPDEKPSGEPELLPEEKPIPEPPEPLPVPEPPAPTPSPEPPTPAPAPEPPSAPEPPKPQAAQPPPIASAAAGKPVMSDVTPSVQRLTGPIEELGSLNVKDFRRLSKKPEEATLKIKDKIDALEDQSFEHKTAGIQAWRESPANKLYLEMLRRSLEGVPVRDVIAAAEAKGEEVFTKEEFDSIMALNRTLRFG